jgi:hypothetical protein
MSSHPLVHPQNERSPMTQGKLTRSSRLKWKHPGSHSRKSSTSTETKIPEIVKSSSSTEKSRLETLYSADKASPTAIKDFEDSDNNKSRS